MVDRCPTCRKIADEMMEVLLPNLEEDTIKDFTERTGIELDPDLGE